MIFLEATIYDSYGKAILEASAFQPNVNKFRTRERLQGGAA
jgi:hypothetical protein